MRASSICATSLGKPPAFAIKKTSETPTLERVAAGRNLFPAALVQSCGLAQDFGGWIGLSAMLVGHAHLVLVACVVQWARSLRKRETRLLTTNVHTSWAVALLLTGLAACIPFAVPAAFVFLTGLVFIPLMYVVTVRGVARERLSLETG